MAVTKSDSRAAMLRLGVVAHGAHLDKELLFPSASGFKAKADLPSISVLKTRNSTSSKWYKVLPVVCTIPWSGTMYLHSEKSE